MARDRSDFDAPNWKSGAAAGGVLVLAALALLVVAIGGWLTYLTFRVEVPSRHIAVLIKKVGKNLPNDMELAPNEEYKGVQIEVMKEGRAFYNPYVWDWQIFPQQEVPDGKLGVLIRLFGDDLPHQQLLAGEGQKGIVSGALRPGRYPDYSNPFAYRIELRDAVTVPAGYKGVVTLVTGTPPKDPNKLLVEDGERGVQKTVLEPGTYFFNPYEKRVSLIDCRTKKVNLSEDQDMGFPSKDGFWIRLDGTIQFHVISEKAAELFVSFNDDFNGDEMYQEVREKIIMPNARSFCRLSGSRLTGRMFIEGKAREEFQKMFQSKMVAECEPLGVMIDSALITKIYPPEPIAMPVRKREIAKQQQNQYQQEIIQQQSEAKLVVERMKIDQKKRLIDAEREVIQMKTKAQEEQQVAVTKAEQELAVAETRLEAAKDQAQAIVAKGMAEADVVRLKNEADASGLRASVAAFGGNGLLFAQQALYERLAPRFQQIMANSQDSPIMQIFEQFQNIPMTAIPVTNVQTQPNTSKGGK